MTREEFRAALDARGGVADVWLVYIEDVYETMLDGRLQLRLEGAFWTRGEAYSIAYRRHTDTPRHQCYVFRLAASADWAASDTARTAELETVVTAASDGREVSVTPTEVAAALQG